MVLGGPEMMDISFEEVLFKAYTTLEMAATDESLDLEASIRLCTRLVRLELELRLAPKLDETALAPWADLALLLGL